MATIEERAKEYATDLRGAYREEFFNESTYRGYVQGATEQRKIDIDKACDAIWTYVEQSPDFVVENYQDRYEFHYERMARDIRNVVRKSMEE